MNVDALMNSNLWLGARMIKTAARTVQLALSALETNAAIHTILPVVCFRLLESFRFFLDCTQILV